MDVGTTLVKFAYKKDGLVYYHTTAIHKLHEIIEILKIAGVTTLKYLSWNRHEAWLKPQLTGFELQRYDSRSDALNSEIFLQAQGTLELLRQQNLAFSDRMLIISHGTGISYTALDNGNIRRFPYGNAFGGGTLFGMFAAFDGLRPEQFTSLCEQGKSLNLYLKDIPAFSESEMKDFVLSNFAASTGENSLADKCRTLADNYVTSVLRDIAMINLVPGYNNFSTIVNIGSTINRIDYLKTRFSNMFFDYKNKNLFPRYMNMHFPDFGEFALAYALLISTD